MVRLVLFDIDGTLILSGGAGEKAFGEVCAEVFGVPNGTAQLNFAGRTDPSIVRDFFTRHDIEPSVANFELFFEHYLKWLRVMLHRLQGRVLPGVSRWMADLEHPSRGVAVGLLTGNIRLGAQIKLSHYKLWGYFQTGAYGDDHEDRNQVAVVARRRGCELLKGPLEGREILVIGDTPRDVECGRAIGAKVLAVATGNYSSDALREHRPDWVVDSLESIQPVDVMAAD